MSDFRESDHPRGQVTNAGQFRDKAHSAPTAVLSERSSDDIPESFYHCWEGPEDKAAEAFSLISCSVLSEPGDKNLGEVIRNVGAKRVLEILRSNLSDTAAAIELFPGGRSLESVRHWRARLDEGQAVERAMGRAQAHGVKVLTCAEGAIPSQFSDLGDTAPLVLWVRGEKAALDGMKDGVTFAGARASTGYGDHVVSEFSAELASAGRTVVSGGSYGIEGAALRASMSAGGKPVCFQAGSPDLSYPAGHNELINRVAESGGAVVSEVAPGTNPNRSRFIARNRLLAAATRETVIVEASSRSSAVPLALKSDEIGRRVWAVPGPITSVSSFGTNSLIVEGTAKALVSVDQLGKD